MPPWLAVLLVLAAFGLIGLQMAMRSRAIKREDSQRPVPSYALVVVALLAAAIVVLALIR